MHLPRRARAAVLGALLSTVAVAGMTGTALAVADDRCDEPRAADPAALALVSTTPRTAPAPIVTAPAAAPPDCPDPNDRSCSPAPVLRPVSGPPTR